MIAVFALLVVATIAVSVFRSFRHAAATRMLDRLNRTEGDI